ncbi:MAG: bifunctional folylpolyglutamate synthase/dihydrofolate synthase [Clostridiales bacterium]|jgi:dihydrofolate synthase/folylpolyglutamate synthase|nr:bifunctional folylpolyglutamate synthase/dihydrofolate synthase [Clostridiales bacterium]
MGLDSGSAIEFFESVSWRGSHLGLERIGKLLSLLGNPQEKMKFVHVAGTNGKGSACSMMSSVLTCAGYRTGLNISPYINIFNERIQVDGNPISGVDLAQAASKVKKAYSLMKDEEPTAFELITAAALQHFHDAKCSISVMEVGLGGRLDATNIIPNPEAALIMPISLDHTEQLGSSLKEIASEKAGIIKPGGAVASSPQEESAASVLRDACAKRGASLKFISRQDLKIKSDTLDGLVFDYGEFKDLHIRLLGRYQPENAAVVAEAVKILRNGGWSISDDAFREGLLKTQWPARFEVVSSEPAVIIEGGHNPQCADACARNLIYYFPGKKVIFVSGIMADKDYYSVYSRIAPIASKIYVAAIDNPRAMPNDELKSHLKDMGIDASLCANVEEGIKAALSQANKDDVICVFGSFYIAGAARKFFLG